MSWRITPSFTQWTPALITTALWLDAADASTFTFSSGTTVNNWASKSGSYVLTQSDNAKRPSRSGTVNGLPTVVFDGGDGMSVANFDLISQANVRASFFAVFTAAAGTTQVILEHSPALELNAGSFQLVRDTSNNVGLLVFGGGSNYSTFYTNGVVTTSAKVYTGTINSILSTNEVSGWLDGDETGVRTFNSNTTANFINATLFLGARNNDSFFMNGQICEIGIISSVVSTLDRQKLEGYLAHKWGLTANLPIGHPYKVNPPAP